MTTRTSTRIPTRERTVVSRLLLSALALVMTAVQANANDDDPWLVAEMQMTSTEEAQLDPEYASQYTGHLAAEAARRLADLRSAIEVAHEIGALEGLIDLGDGHAIGIYDANGIWDPLSGRGMALLCAGLAVACLWSVRSYFRESESGGV